MDLINKLGKEKADKTEKPIDTAVPAVKHAGAGDMISQAKGTGTKVETETKQPEETTETKASENPDSEGVADPDSWTKDSAFKEVKKLREENKTYRIKYEEKLLGLKDEMTKTLTAKEQE